MWLPPYYMKPKNTALHILLDLADDKVHPTQTQAVGCQYYSERILQDPSICAAKQNAEFSQNTISAVLPAEASTSLALPSRPTDEPCW